MDTITLTLAANKFKLLIALATLGGKTYLAVARDVPPDKQDFQTAARLATIIEADAETALDVLTELANTYEASLAQRRA